MPGPLSRLGLGSPEPEADVIFTAVVLGFCKARVIQSHPFSFDTDSMADADLTKLRRAVTAILTELRRGGAVQSPERFISGNLSPEHRGMGDALITGRSGGQAMTPMQRNRPMSNQRAVGMAQWEYRTAWGEDEAGGGQYHGFGAYTGMIDDPVGGHTLIQPTIRRVINDPARWSPDRGTLWGLIGTRNNGGEFGANLADTTLGMGPVRRHRGIVQYVHGMSWAMREAIRWGPWCTPYEMAVGHVTSKRASCFACTTYMWAAGFPASSSHIGAGESWGTLPDGTLADEDFERSEGAEGDVERAIARSLNIRWNAELFHYLREGARMMNTDPMDAAHRAAAQLLRQAVDDPARHSVLTGGNLFLDAMTWHKNDATRIIDTLRPA